MFEVKSFWERGEDLALLNNEPNPEECDATDDDSSTSAGLIKILHLFTHHYKCSPEIGMDVFFFDGFLCCDESG